MTVKWYEFETTVGFRYKSANPSFSSGNGIYSIDVWTVSESEFNRVLSEWEADQQTRSEPDTQDEKSQWVPKVGDWVRMKDLPADYESPCGGRFDGHMRKFCGRVMQVTAINSGGAEKDPVRICLKGDEGWWFVADYLEPAEPQLIDKLGWWLVDSKTWCIVTFDCDMWVDTTGESFESTLEGIFLAEITDEELAAYHRNGIVPKCPVEVQA